MDYHCASHYKLLISKKKRLIAYLLKSFNKIERIYNKECYDSMLKRLSKELTLVLSDTRELDRVPNTK